MTYDQAFAMLPNVGGTGTKSVDWSCSFGNPGDDGYSEIWRGKDCWRYEISRADHCDDNGWNVKAEFKPRLNQAGYED